MHGKIFILFSFILHFFLSEKIGLLFFSHYLRYFLQQDAEQFIGGVYNLYFHSILPLVLSEY